MKKAEPGGWYFYVQCTGCNRDIIFQKAPPPEELAHPRIQGLNVKCPHCGKEDTYPAAQVRRGQVEDKR
jgi:ribosomal protein S27E